MTDSIGRFAECLTHVLYDVREAVKDDSTADEPALDWQPAGNGNETRVAFIPPTGTEQLADKARAKLHSLYFAAIVEAEPKYTAMLQEGRTAAEDYIEAAVSAAEAKRPAPPDDAFLRLNNATVELRRLWNALPKGKASSEPERKPPAADGAIWLGDGRIEICGKMHFLTAENDQLFIEFLLDHAGVALTRELEKDVSNPSATAKRLIEWENGILAPYISTPNGKKNAGYKTTIQDGRKK